MGTALKSLYSESFYNKLSESLIRVLPGFDKQRFLELIYEDGFEQKELKERMRHTSRILHVFLSENFSDAVNQIKKIIVQLRKDHFSDDRLEFIFLPDYIELYGMNNVDSSLEALEYITQFVSCEFAIRPFLLKQEKKVIARMKKWSRHESFKVRRLSSEGSRPRLPWAMAIPSLKKDPSPVIPILENLKSDPSEWVRLSVANNLNDIAKDHPDLVLEIARKWKGISKETDAIIKHGSRTLLKKGHAEILKHYGLSSQGIELSGFNIKKPKIKTGDTLEFSFSLINKNKTPQIVRLEYAIYYKTKKAILSKKVFKISERIYQPAEKADIRRKQKFTPITTRKFYPGQHQLSVIINGKENLLKKFHLAG